MSTCEDENGNIHDIYPFTFDDGWWYTALCLCIVFTSFPVYDFTINKSRDTPSKLMLGRTISNFCQALVFLGTVKSDKINICATKPTCDILGSLFTIFLIVSAAYYTTMCVDLYFTLRNPFRRPVSNSMWIHFIVIFIAVVAITPISIGKAFEYREDFQFCWTKYRDGFNFWNLFIVYVPAGAVVIGGILVTYWSLKRLQSRILDDTFELRWKIIKRQTAIVVCFTFAYMCQGVIWLVTFMEPDGSHAYFPTAKPPQPYLLSVFVLCGVFFDLIAWCAKDNILVCWKTNKIASSSSNMFDDTETAMDSMNDIVEQIIEVEIKELKDHKEHTAAYRSPNLGCELNRPVTARSKLLKEKYDQPKKNKNKDEKLGSNQNLSNALRREVITFITAGLVTGVKVCAWETNKKNDIGNTYDDDFDGDDGFEFGSNYREDTETHPALQLFHHSNPSRPALNGHGVHSHEKPKKKHFPKANSYAGFLFDGRAGRKGSDKMSTDSTNGFSDRHHKGSSYQYSGKIGLTSTVAVSIPLGIGQYRYDVKERGSSSLDSVPSDLEVEMHDDHKYNHYHITNTRDITAKRSTIVSSTTTDDHDDIMSSSLNETPDVSQGSRSDSDDIDVSTTLNDANKLIVLDNNISSGMSSFNHDDDDETMNAEDGDNWNEQDQTLEFDMMDMDHPQNDIYSESLLATAEGDPPYAYYPQSIRLKRRSTNRGTVNRFNIGIAGSARVSFTDYAPHVFRYLRTEIYQVSDRNYLESILPPKFNGEITKVSEDIIAKFSEGRSGAFFFFSPDNKYVIKTLTTHEAQLLIDTLSGYVKYMKQNGQKTYLTRYFGLHSVKLYSKVIYFMVSQNVFPSDKDLADNIMERYDIKGSWIDRHTNRHLFEKELMKDEDLHRKLQLDPITSTNIHNQLAKDTAFLEKQNIMDYSLLLGISYQQITNSDLNNNNNNQNNPSNFFNKKPVYNFAGVDENTETDPLTNKLNGNYDNMYTVKANKIEGPGTYYIGIIDMLQKWDKEKQGEKFLKVYFRCKNRAGISCVEPVFYRKRFLTKMQKIGM